MRFFRTSFLSVVFVLLTTVPSFASLGLGHLYTANAFLDRMPSDLSDMLSEENGSYLIGANGQDLIYWAYRLSGSLQTPEWTHEVETGRQCIELLRLAKKAGNKEKAFAVGWVTHWLTDSYVHSLVDNYGGRYAGGNTEKRHVQLEIVESKHVCEQPSFPLRGYILLDEDVPYDFLYTAAKTIEPSPQRLTAHIFFPSSKATFVIGDSIKCLLQSCRTQKAECDWSSASWWGWYSEDASLVSSQDYKEITKPLEIRDIKIENGRLQAKIGVFDNELYGKFLREWNYITGDLMSFVEREQFFKKVGDYLSDREDYGDSWSILRQYFNKVNNILTPENELNALDGNALTRFSDGTLRGEPDISELEYEFLASCDDGDTIAKSDLIKIDFKGTRLRNSRYGEAVIEFDVDKDKTCEYAFLVSFADPKARRGSYTLSSPTGKTIEKRTDKEPKVIVLSTKKEADYEFRKLEFDTVTGNFKGKKTENVTISISPSSATLLPEATETFTATVTGTKNVDVIWAVEINGEEMTGTFELNGGKLRSSGPNQVILKAPSYEGKYTLKAQSKADPKKIARSSIDVKAKPATGHPYGVEIAHLPCIKKTGSTCDNNKVVYEFYRVIENNLAVKLKLPEGLDPDDIDDLPLVIIAEYDGVTTPTGMSWENNCPPAIVRSSDSSKFLSASAVRQGGEIIYRDLGIPSYTGGGITGQKAPSVTFYLDVTDNVARPPIYNWNYKKGDRFAIGSFNLPECSSSSGPTGEQAKPDGLVPLVLKLSADKTKVNIGDKVNVTASVSGGKPPYTYAWTGEYEGQGDTVTFKAKKPGSYTLKLSVSDSGGQTETGSITLTVAQLKVLIEKISPGSDIISIGAHAKFRAKITSEGQEIKGNYIYRWEPLNEMSFSPQEEDKNETTAAFIRPGKLRIWVSVLEKINGVLNTVAESAPIEIEIVPPQMEIVLSLSSPQVCQETKASIVLKDKIGKDKIEFQWLLPKNASLISETSDRREIIFFPKDSQPIKIVLRARTPHYGDDLGEKSVTLNAQSSDVKVLLIGPTGKKPEGLSLLNRPNEIAVNQQVSLRASIAPQQEGSIKFLWITKDGSPCRFAGDNFGTEAIMYSTNTSTCEVVVEAQGQRGCVLGKGTTTFRVTISQEELDAATKAKEAAEKLSTAKELIAQGKLDEAVRIAEEAAKLDPKSAKPFLTEISQACKKKGWDAVSERDFDAGITLLKTASRLNPDDKDAKEKLDKAKKFQKIWPQVEQKAKEFDNLIAEKKVVTAYKKILEIQDLQNEMPGTMGNKFSQNIMNTWHKANEEYNKFIQEALKQHTEYFNAMDWDGMLAHAQDVLKREHSPAEQKNWESNVNFAKQKISERNQAWQYYQSVKSIFEKGDQTQAYGMLGELNTKPQYFMKSDPRRQQILDLIAALEKWHKIRSAKGYAMNLFFAGEQVLRDYHYGQAAEAFAEGLRAIRDNGDMNDPVYAKYYTLYQDCVAKDKRLKELFPGVQSAAMDEKPLPLETIEKALRGAEEMVALQPNNTDSQIYKSRLEQKIKNAQKEKENKALADALWKEGEGLFNENRYPDSLGKFKESLKLWSNQERQKYVSDLEKAIAARKAKAKKLRDEGEALQTQGKLREAIGKYRESLTHWPDPALEEHIKMIEAKITGDVEKKAKADSLWQEGTDFFNQNKLSDALDKFRESLGYWKNDTRVKYVRDLEAKLEEKKVKCRKLNDEGYSLQQQGKLKEALTRYREEAKYCPSPALEDHISKIEAEMRNQQNEQAKKACAKKNRDEGAALQQQGRLQEALAKYRESYNCLPTPEMEQHIKTIENMTTQTPTVSSVQVEGPWEFDGTDLTLAQQGNQLTGKYTEDNGELIGRISGNVFEGYWIEDHSARKCASPNNGRYYWGKFRIEFEGNRLTGRWSYCEDKGFESRIWHGTKKGGQKPLTVNLTGSWSAKCTGGDAYTAKVTQSGSSFEAQVDTEHYRGTITGNRISGKSADQIDTITGEIISNNELRVVLTGYMGSSPIKNTCTLTRGSSGSSIPKDNASGKTLSVRVKNSSGQNVHIYPQGGKCSPDNKLTPKQSRTITVSVPSDGFLKFCAGRNGKEIECKKQGIDPGNSGYTYTVIFDESNPFKKLLIYTGLK